MDGIVKLDHYIKYIRCAFRNGSRGVIMLYILYTEIKRNKIDM